MLHVLPRQLDAVRLPGGEHVQVGRRPQARAAERRRTTEGVCLLDDQCTQAGIGGGQRPDQAASPGADHDDVVLGSAGHEAILVEHVLVVKGGGLTVTTS